MRLLYDLMRALRLADHDTNRIPGNVAKYVFKPLSWLPDKARDSVLYKLIMAGQPTPLALQVPRPPINKISTPNYSSDKLGKAIAFYKKFGFQPIGHAVLQQFLKGGGHSCWMLLLLLVGASTMAPRANSYDIGMTRLCLYTTNIEEEVAKLKSKGLKLIYPVANDSMAKIAAYKDPDGFVVYYIQFKHVIAWVCKYLG